MSVQEPADFPSGRRATDRRGTRPDATMALLTDLLADRGDDAYAAASRRRHGDVPVEPDVEASGRQRWRMPVFLVTLALIAVTLTTSALAHQRSIGGLATARTSLVAHVGAQTATNRGLEARIDAASRDITAARRAAASDQARRQSLAERLVTLTGQVGLTAVSGIGYVVSVDDRQSAEPLTDRELQRLVNALWSMGATDIAVSGHRLVATSAIRTAGEAILVDYRPLSAPYVVAALAPAATEQQVAAALADISRTLTARRVVLGVRPARSVALPAGRVPALRHASVS